MRIDWPSIAAQLRPGPGADFREPLHARSICGVLPSALELLGIDPGGETGRLPELPAGLAGRKFRKLLFCLIDSLGLDDLAGRAGMLTSWVEERGTWVSSVFPSITSSAIVSITHGVPPARHGIYGHMVWNSRIGNVVDMLSLRLDGGQTSLPDAGVDVTRWTRTNSLLRQQVLGDHRCYHVTKKELLGSGLSNFIYPSTVTRIGYETLTEGLSKVRRILERDEPSVVSFYSSIIDYTSHVFGKDSPEFSHQLVELERALEWTVGMLSPGLRSETLLAVVSDHGQSSYDPAKRIDLSKRRQEVYRSWAPHHGVGLSGRVLHLYGEGRPPAEVTEALEKDVGALGVVLSREEANLLAGADPRMPSDGAEDLGTQVVVLHDGAYFDYEVSPERTKFMQANMDHLVSNHGSLTPQELLVPVVLAPLDALV